MKQYEAKKFKWGGIMIKRKGQIVPRYLVQSVEKKSAHLVKFGADVEITGRTIKVLSEGYVIVIPAVTHVLKKKNQRTVKGFNFVDISIDSSKAANGSMYA